MIDELVEGSAEAKLDFSNNAAESVDENMNTAEPAVETSKKIVEDANTMADGPSLSAGEQIKIIYFQKANFGSSWLRAGSYLCHSIRGRRGQVSLRLELTNC